jgi:hypothetical protein
MHVLTDLVTLPFGRLPSTLSTTQLRDFSLATDRFVRTLCLSASAAFRAWD